MIVINGIKTENAAGKSIADYLAESGYDSKRVAVELNGEILPKSKYGSTPLNNGDCVEIVSFVGGG